MEQLAINIHWTVVNQGHIPLGLFSWFLFWYKNNRTYRISLPKRTDFVLFWKQNKPNQFCSYFAGELQLHLQSMVNLLRDEDVLRLVGYAEFKKILILWLLGVYGIDKDKLFEQFDMYTIGVNCSANIISKWDLTACREHEFWMMSSSKFIIFVGILTKPISMYHTLVFPLSTSVKNIFLWIKKKCPCHLANWNGSIWFFIQYIIRGIIYDSYCACVGKSDGSAKCPFRGKSFELFV